MEAITQDQLNSSWTELSNKHQKEKTDLLANFARSNDIVKNGDLITDDTGTIKVHARKVVYGGIQYTTMMYHGIRVKKDGTPFKSGEYAWIYQPRIKLINGKPID